MESGHLLADLRHNLGIKGLVGVRIVQRYDVEGLSEELFRLACGSVFSEPQVDRIYDALPEGDRVFAVEYLPGQFDQRADSAAQCVQLMTGEERPLVRSAKVYLLEGTITDEEFEAIKKYLVNPVEAREASLELPETLADRQPEAEAVPEVPGFLDDAVADETFLTKYALAMDADDVRFCRDYFRGEGRCPTLTELRMIDTYWSDHCRHTTFLTEIDGVEIENEAVRRAFEKYLEIRKALYAGRDKPMTLMDIATIGTKELKREGKLKNLDESEEINACSIRIPVTVNGKEEEYLLMFKNETHNHPTEIEPFGGAATCLGGAIRDPLSGRAYVYQAMRITGAADPRLPVKDTMPGKLPQRKIVTTAANGYSSYGNQIGLATGFVNEVYHPNYVAKRMELGAVMGCAPAKNVVRERPAPGDVIILLGGRTGRDGCGGATGSSKSHTASSLETCGAEVQKGNPPEERKIQRLFRNPEATTLIKRCNDFGAGGVSVAIGELADGLLIDLDRVPKKYSGLSGTELAISESQERMAVVVRREDVEKFIALANGENIEATEVAVVTEEPRLVMEFGGKKIVDLSREFLNSNGAKKRCDVAVPAAQDWRDGFAVSGDFGADLARMVSDLSVCSQKGLVERFDGSIGAGSVLMPYGGRSQTTPAQAMVAKIPVLEGETDTASVMAYGFDPYISEKNPFAGAKLAVIESVAKAAAAGANVRECYLTLQEFFPRTKGEAGRWGLPFAALLGALDAQLGLSMAAIGGKDSMSGTFEEIDVPPTLVSFAVAPTTASGTVTPEFKAAGDTVRLLEPEYDAEGLPTYESVLANYDAVYKLAQAGKVRAAYALTRGGVAEAAAKMSFGNGLGVAFEGISEEELFALKPGALLLECDEELGRPVGTVVAGELRLDGQAVSTAELCEKWERPLEEIFPTKAEAAEMDCAITPCGERSGKAPAIKAAEPRVVIPVFPGTNCEYDTARAFERAGAKAKIVVIRNLSQQALRESIAELERGIRESQIVMIPGGFSGGDEPEGSGKFICAVFRNPAIREAVTAHLEQRDGLMLGICNGFQALIKLGLVPYGKIVDTDEHCPTLTFNNIGRHQSMMVNTVVSSVKSPWLAGANVGDIHTVAISHGEGKFVASPAVLEELVKNGQIATQYVDAAGRPTMAMPYNPNGSALAIEGITSPDGRVFGKMAHSERCGENIFKNIPGEKDQGLFRAGVEYFR